MYHKVFINNVQIVIANKPERGMKIAPQFSSVDDLYDWINAYGEEKGEVFIEDLFGNFWQSFHDYHTRIEAAGGMVENEQNELLVIHRLGKWDLPKGKLEGDEKPEMGAVREVEEECGITELNIVEKLPSTFHTYQLKGQPILKKTHWFKMTCPSGQELIPQIEEDIHQVVFMNQESVRTNVLENTYASLLDLFNAYLLGNE